MNKQEKVKLISLDGKEIELEIDADVLMLILNCFGFSFYKMFVDRAYAHGIIGILLMYVPLASTIHGIYLAVNREYYFKGFQKDGYMAVDQETADLIKKKIGLVFAVKGQNKSTGQKQKATSSSSEAVKKEENINYTQKTADGKINLGSENEQKESTFEKTNL